MYFRIEQAPIDEPMKGRTFYQRGVERPTDPTFPVVLYLYDDDGEHYFTIGCSCDEAAEHAFDQIGPAYGVTYSKISMSRNEPATPFIG